MPNPLIVPNVGVMGVITLAAPFANAVAPNTPYKVAAVRSLADIASSGIDPFQTYYLPNGLTQADYQTDLQAGVCILSLQSTSDSWVYVPNSYLLTIPQSGGIPYTNMMVGVNLGALPNTLSLAYFMSVIKEAANDLLGVTSADVRSVIVSATTYIPQSTSAAYEAARQGVMNSVVTDRAKYLNSERARLAAIEKISILENYITGIILQLQQAVTAGLVTKPINTVLPVMTGTPNVGNELSCTTGTWTGTEPIAYSYQWFDGVNSITNAINPNYVVQPTDVGNNVNCIVYASNTATMTTGGVSATSNTAGIVVSAPANLTAPVVSGTPIQGVSISASNGNIDPNILSCNPGTWAGYPLPNFTYQWRDGSVDITGAINSTYQLQQSDIGATLNCVVTATSSEGTATANSNVLVAVTAVPAIVVLPVVTATRTISGTTTSINSGSVEPGDELSCTTGTWTGTTSINFLYQWNNGANPIVGADTDTYTVQVSDASTPTTVNTIYCTITAQNSAALTEINAGDATTSTYTSSSNGMAITVLAPVNIVIPTISGLPIVGNELTCLVRTWTGYPAPTFTYQWLGNGVNIAGAVSSTYTPQITDVSSVITCTVTATNVYGIAEVTTNATLAVSETPVNTTLPAIAGIAEPGNILTCNTGVWTGIPTPTFTYQWQNIFSEGVPTNIANATASSYTVQLTDIGATIRCNVIATNAAGEVAATSNVTTTIT